MDDVKKVARWFVLLLFTLLMGYLMLGGIFNAIALLNSTAFSLDRVIQHGLTALVFFSAATALGVFYYLGNIASHQSKLVEG